MIVGVTATPNSVPRAWSATTWPATQLFRDGLFLLLGLMCPERRRALESLRVSQVDLAGRRIVFDARQIKTSEARERELPPELAMAIEVWLEKWRGRYAPTHDGLWIATGGKPVGSGTLYAAMRTLTQDRLGVGLSPHRLRDLAATFVVETAPERAALASAMLAHKSMSMTQKYTLTASQIEASRMGHALLDAAERAVRKRAL